LFFSWFHGLSGAESLLPLNPGRFQAVPPTLRFMTSRRPLNTPALDWEDGAHLAIKTRAAPIVAGRTHRSNLERLAVVTVVVLGGRRAAIGARKFGRLGKASLLNLVGDFPVRAQGFDAVLCAAFKTKKRPAKLATNLWTATADAADNARHLLRTVSAFDDRIHLAQRRQPRVWDVAVDKFGEP
jgi:hypothetical protein